MSRIQEVRKRTRLDESAMRAVDREFASLGDENVRSEPIAGQAGTTLEDAAAPLVSNTDPILLETLLACPRFDWTPDSESMVFLGNKDLARSTEEFRALRFRLCEMRKQRPIKSLLVTSALRGEGRSFVAANLAQAMALQHDCRVLLIDADLRNSRLHSLLGTSNSPGLSDYLLREADAFAIIQRGQDDGLFFIPAGGPAPAPTEIIGNGRLRSLLRRVEPLFEWIVVDSPAAIPVSDACALADCCDGVLMVVRSNATSVDVVRKAQERFSEEALAGVILNRIEKKPQRDRSSGARLRLSS